MRRRATASHHGGDRSGDYDYRQTHLDHSKGRSYAERFRANPHRALMWRLEQMTLDEILANLSQERGLRHLDFACGTGRILAHVRPHAHTSVGVDVSDSMLEVARERCENARLLTADLTRDAALGDEQFDLITAFRFFPNAQPPLRAEAMAAIRRHLAPKGIVIFNNHLNSASMFLRTAHALGRARSLGMSDEEARDLVTGAGLQVAEVYGIGLLPSNERLLLLPKRLVAATEGYVQRRQIGTRFCQNLIYVCRDDA